MENTDKTGPNEKEYVCNFCSKTYKKFKFYCNHLKIHVEQKGISCSECGLNFKSMKLLQKHEAQHEGSTKLFCKICNRYFQTDEELKKHKTGKHLQKVKKKKCRICSDSVFEREEDYLLHIKDVHNGKFVDNFICEDCGKQFRTKSELRHHIESKCGTIKRFKCKVCSQELMTAGSLHNHLLIHSGVRYFMCRFCAKQFLTAGQLKVHERMHTQEKVFRCHVCGKGFCHRQSLITHSTLHTGIKPYQCDNCGNSFSCIGNLLKHRKSHLDTCGSIPLTTHRVNNPSTRIKIKVNTPATSKLKILKKNKEIDEKLRQLEEMSALHSNNLNDTNELLTQLKSDHLIKDNIKVQSNARNVNVYIGEDQSLVTYEENVSNETDNINDVGMELDNDEDNFETSLDLANDIKVEMTNLNKNKILQKKTLKKKNSRNQNSPEKSFKKNSNKISSSKTEIVLKAKEDERTERKYCEKTINDSKLIQNHKISHETVRKMYSCSCCKESFEKKDDCKNHQLTMHADILTCQECDKIFSSRDSLRNHQKITHEKVPKKSYLYICEKCGKIFKQKQTLQNHRDSSCGTSLVFECEICHKKFTSVYIRRNHMKVHEAKKLLCKFCGKSFHWKGQLKVHERSHTGEKPYTCLYCPKAFSYRESLLTHSTIHTGIKPYICESCGNGFSCIGNLIKHRDAHVNVCGAYNKKQK